MNNTNGCTDKRINPVKFDGVWYVFRTCVFEGMLNDDLWRFYGLSKPETIKKVYKTSQKTYKKEIKQRKKAFMKRKR